MSAESPQAAGAALKHPADADTPAAVPVLAIAGLALAAGASGMALRLADALLPRLADEFAVTLGRASMVITAFAVAYGLAQLVFGPLGDRYGKYRVIAWACAASAVTSLACALAPGYGALLAARLLAGATAAAVIPLSMAWIGDVVPYAQRQPVLARFLVGQISGFALGVWLGGYTAEHLPWRAPFFALALIFLVVAGTLQWLRRSLPPAALRPPGSGASGPAAAVAAMLREFSAVLAQRWPRLVLAVVFIEGALVFGPFAFIAAHLHQRLALPLSTVGALVMGFALGGLGFALNAHWLVARLGEPRLVRSGSLLMATALLAIALAPGPSWALLACVLMGLGFYMMHNTLQTQATQMAPERRGAAVAAFAACLFLGQSAGVGVAGLVVGRIGTGWVIATGALALPALAWGFNRQRRLAAAAAPR